MAIDNNYTKRVQIESFLLSQIERSVGNPCANPVQMKKGF